MEPETASIEQLLGAIESVQQKWIPKLKVNEALGKQFNVFSLCGIDHYETWHSRILAEFLDPNGSHGQKALFLKLFAKRFLPKQNGDTPAFDKARVSTEVTSYIKNLRIGRFDILIEDEKNKTVCIVENKIFAEEQPEQLSRYSTWLENERGGDWATHLVFLTLDGRKSETIEGKQDYIRLAYYLNPEKQVEPEVKNLSDWLEDCSNSVKEIPRLCYTLVQYTDHVKNLATGDTAMNHEIVNAMREHMKAASLVYKQYQTACVQQANELLMKDVVHQLKMDNYGEWETESSCSFSAAEKGIKFVPPRTIDTNDFYGQIWVYFNKTNLQECQIALWQDPDHGKKGILLNAIPDVFHKKESWNKQSGPWLLWRGILSECSKDHGMIWDGDFFDKVRNDPDFKQRVIDDIAKSIETLFDFQKASLPNRE